MTYRLKLFTINVFCLFSLFFVGCNEKIVDPFIHYDLVKSNDATINTDDDFPQSIEFDYVKASLLRAGSYQGNSFYIEYYKLDNKNLVQAKVLKDGNWKTKNTYQFKLENRQLSGKTLKESSIYFQKEDFLMYGVFIGPKAIQFDQIIMGFQKK
ncbi:hypothetical protein MJH12_07490 [bacterium]|nr:hypothetical protein [bacterium]